MRTRSLISLILILATILVLADLISSTASHEQDMREMIEQIEEEVIHLRQELAITRSNQEDLSVAFINHHGNYPRRINNGRAKFED